MTVGNPSRRPKLDRFSASFGSWILTYRRSGKISVSRSGCSLIAIIFSEQDASISNVHGESGLSRRLILLLSLQRQDHPSRLVANKLTGPSLRSISSPMIGLISAALQAVTNSITPVRRL